MMQVARLEVYGSLSGETKKTTRRQGSKHVEAKIAYEIAHSANVIARWCGMRDARSMSDLVRAATSPEGEPADLFVLFGGGVIGSADMLAHAMKAGAARRYAIVGGRGHATYWLDQAYEREQAQWDNACEDDPEPYVASEAEMLNAVLRHRHGRAADLLECLSTNCGNNITYLLDLLEGEQLAPACIILCQDAVMQRRMDATWQRQVCDRPRFSATRVLNWASYQAELTAGEGGLTWAKAPEGIWSIDKYLQLLMGEVARLTDDAQGYGPNGRDFVVHVEVPSEVTDACERLKALLGEEGRPPDERYA